MGAFRLAGPVASGSSLESDQRSGKAGDSRAGALLKRIGLLGRSNGFGGFALVAIGRLGAADDRPFIVEADMPPAVREEFQAGGDFTSCSLMVRLHLSTMAFGFDVGRSCLDGVSLPSGIVVDDGPIDALFARVGVAGGYCVPVHTVDGRRGAIVFGGRRGEAGQSYPQLVHLAQMLFEDLARARPQLLLPPKRRLGEIERAAFDLMREGLTIADAAAALGLSPIAFGHLLRSVNTKVAPPVSR